MAEEGRRTRNLRTTREHICLIATSENRRARVSSTTDEGEPSLESAKADRREENSGGAVAVGRGRPLSDDEPPDDRLNKVGEVGEPVTLWQAGNRGKDSAVDCEHP